ncbi:MAG TPA: hypothetical protein VJ870_19090 [Amycolatopsis sp.]|nr:hypothetical protein [Amycolatopsis sp.]
MTKDETNEVANSSRTRIDKDPRRDEAKQAAGHPDRERRDVAEEAQGAVEDARGPLV